MVTSLWLICDVDCGCQLHKPKGKQERRGIVALNNLTVLYGLWRYKVKFKQSFLSVCLSRSKYLLVLEKPICEK